MVNSCCIVGCKKRSDKEKHLHFYRIPDGKTPLEEKRRRDWLSAIKRTDWKKPEWTTQRINKQRVCSYHFLSGQRSDDPNDIDWIPTRFDHNGAVPKQVLNGIKTIERRKSCSLI